MRQLAIILFLAVAAHSRAALTLVQRETFQSVATLSSGTPGNLGTVTGNFYKRAVGPRLTSDTTANSLGWSADLRLASQTNHDAYHVISIVGTAAEWKGTLSMFYYFDTVTNNGANVTSLCSFRQANGNQLLGLQLDSSTGNFRYISQGVASGDSGVAVPLKTWIEVRLSWENTSAASFGNYNVEAAYRVAGGSSWTSIYSRLNFGTGSNPGTAVRGGSVNGAGTSGVFNGRYGMPSLYALGAFTDRTILVSDVTDPASGAHTWYFNPNTGSDSNDGTDSSHPIQTASEFNTASTYCGFFPASTYATGDTVVVDTSGGAWDITSAGLTVSTSGLNMRAATGQTYATLRPYKTLVAGDWSTTGTGNVYSTTNTVAKACLWENDKWLTHVNGANFAAVAATLGSTAGSFYVDATGPTLYVHPFGDTDPRSDGKTYTRSHAGVTGAAVNLSSPNVNIQDLYVSKTCDVDPSTGLPNAGYAIGTGVNWAGTNLVKHCYTTYTGKHGFGFVANSLTGEDTTIDTCDSEQGSPYGSQNPFVSFNGTSVTNLTHRYVNCTVTADTGVIGSTTGVSGNAQAVYSHNTSGSNQFALISITGCQFGNSYVSTTNAVVALTITNTIFGGDNGAGATTKTITGCKWTRYVPTQNRTDGTMTIRNNLIIPVRANYADSDSQVEGTATIEGNTYDFTNVTLNAATVSGILTRIGATTLTFRDNVIIFPVANQGGNTFSVFKSFVNTDTKTITNNVVLLNGSTWAKSYNDGSATTDRTFSQWQALGFDANSQNVSSVVLDGNYKPKHGSPVINTGADIGPLADYSGRLFAVRNDVGAYEFMEPLQSLLRRGGRRH